MEHVFPRITETDIRGLYLNDTGKGRIAYFPGDIDRIFWQIMSGDHGRLLENTIKWALNEEPVIEVKGPGVIDVTVWRQSSSMTVHLVNLTNPMMMKGPSREFIPVAAETSIKLPRDLRATDIRLLVSGQKVPYRIENGRAYLKIPEIYDHEIIGIDLE